MKWKRSRKAKEQVDTAREHKMTNENPALEPDGAGLGKQDVEEEEDVDDEYGFNTDTHHSDFLQKDVNVRYASEDEVDGTKGGDRKMGRGYKEPVTDKVEPRKRGGDLTRGAF